MKKHWMRAVVVAIAFAAPLPFGCRAVLGIGDYELSDAGTDGNVDPFSCEAYCNTIMAQCNGGMLLPLEYKDLDTCLGFCATIPKGNVTDTTGNTLGCRLAVSLEEPGDCVHAGPSGGGQCGGDCESFCHAAVQVCAKEFPSEPDCLTTCAQIPDCQKYTSSLITPMDATLGCRMWHVAAGSVGANLGSTDYASNQVAHCKHVAGMEECSIFVPADAGDDGKAACDTLDGGP